MLHVHMDHVDPETEEVLIGVCAVGLDGAVVCDGCSDTAHVGQRCGLPCACHRNRAWVIAPQ